MALPKRDVACRSQDGAGRAIFSDGRSKHNKFCCTLQKFYQGAFNSGPQNLLHPTVLARYKTNVLKSSPELNTN